MSKLIECSIMSIVTKKKADIISKDKLDESDDIFERLNVLELDLVQ